MSAPVPESHRSAARPRWPVGSRPPGLWRGERYVDAYAFHRFLDR
ncbi:MAG TPA: hypothetical protein VIT41_00165 [Microlunatus sp.]